MVNKAGNSPKLKIGEIDFNNKEQVEKLIREIKSLLKIRENYYSIKFKLSYYFNMPTVKPLSKDEEKLSKPGWYIILWENKPIYVGKATSLNIRLNTTNGSLDNYALKKRKADSERNFIKKFNELKIFKYLRVVVIFKKDLLNKLKPYITLLKKVDMKNLEKLINIYRSDFNFIS